MLYTIWDAFGMQIKYIWDANEIRVAVTCRMIHVTMLRTYCDLLSVTPMYLVTLAIPPTLYFFIRYPT